MNVFELNIWTVVQNWTACGTNSKQDKYYQQEREKKIY
jgi:hypothetical protein